MVLVPTQDKIKLYIYFLKEGVFCFKKDNVNKNENLDIPNLHCFLIMRSLVSRKYATEIFSWQWHYYFLTPEGIKYLRDYLGLPSTVIPNTYKFNDEEQQEEGGEQQEEGEKKEAKEKPAAEGEEDKRGGKRQRGRGSASRGGRKDE